MKWAKMKKPDPRIVPVQKKNGQVSKSDGDPAFGNFNLPLDERGWNRRSNPKPKGNQTNK